ncbi:hypothetical protein AAJ76_2100052520 [Vairimorpha ceranae]|uniref:Uncharacterized protein n=1 Tax=Vairimorpha ceranae TaxID=40302 RepID=A0A0F9ZD03_9MICR|nr:hypothetical protein AAJ76_2100052520 [Vairimorpha ceranae]KKO75459.1 hypothetical protein AAJ76_2100052520 [Vairimorpha ceranae]
MFKTLRIPALKRHIKSVLTQIQTLKFLQCNTPMPIVSFAMYIPTKILKNYYTRRGVLSKINSKGFQFCNI